MDIKKVSEEQLTSLRELQSQYDILTKRYGELHFEMMQIDNALSELESKRLSITEILQNEFGTTGTVDLATGIFTPDQK